MDSLTHIAIVSCVGKLFGDDMGALSAKSTICKKELGNYPGFDQESAWKLTCGNSGKESKRSQNLHLPE